MVNQVNANTSATPQDNISNTNAANIENKYGYNMDDLLNKQMEMARWSMENMMKTNMVKTVTDTLKSVANNMR